MSHAEFVHLLSSIDALSPDQMRRLCRELETRIAAVAQSAPRAWPRITRGDA